MKMNTVLVLVLLILVIFALKEGMVWVALGVGLLMVIISTSESSGTTKTDKSKFYYPTPEMGPIQDPKEQMLRVKYQPGWDGNNWWEEVADHWGSSIGRTIGLLR
jgi:hypothetical protein